MTGLGDTGTTVNIPGVSTDVAVQLGQLAPAQLQAIVTQLQTTAATAAPAVSLAETVSSGATPSPAEIVGGLAALATVAAGPVAGAAMAAVGAGVLAFEAGLQGLFTALGLYSKPSPQYNYIGFLRQGFDPLPYGLSDPIAIDLSSYAKLYSFVYQGGDAQHPELNGDFDLDMISLFFNAYLQQMSRSELQAAYGPTADVSGLYIITTQFEKFFYALFIKSMELWANALPFIHPQSLLAAAVTVWNSQHSDSSTVIFSPKQDAKGATPLISSILGPFGDLPSHSQDEPPVVINTGDLVTAQPKVISLHLNPTSSIGPVGTAVSTSTTGTSVAKGAALTIGGVTLATLIYSWAIGKSAGFVLDKVWDGTKSLFNRPVHVGEALESAFGVSSNPIESGEGTAVQTLLFSKSRFDTSSAKAWARKHGYVTRKVDLTSHNIRLRQHPPEEFRRLRTVKFAPGIQGVIGWYK